MTREQMIDRAVREVTGPLERRGMIDDPCTQPCGGCRRLLRDVGSRFTQIAAIERLKEKSS